MKIVIFKEKHGDRHFDISTPDRRLRVFETVLKDRFEVGWYPDLKIDKVLGDKMAERFLTVRKKYEYEDFEIVDVTEL